MRRFASALVALLLSISAVHAGDYADRLILGFSADGAYFAFEEYGVQDGSGFPYSTIYVIETATDSWVPGTPIRIRIDDESITLQEARDQAYIEAEAILQEFGIGLPGRHLVANPITEFGDRRNVEFVLRAFTPLQSTGWTLTLEERLLANDCPDIGYTIAGFSLWLASPEGETRELNNDKTIPESRGCPVGYRVADVFAFDQPGETILIILLDMFQIGFEGPDRRFLAIATTVGE